MTRFVAEVGLLALTLLLLVGNMWFTYGIWPRSWSAFVLFGFSTFVIVILRVAMDREK